MNAMTLADHQAVSASPDASATDNTRRMEELVEIVRAYNDVTTRMEEAHEQLNSEVARLQKELASANAALQRSRRLAALGEMAAGIAHEIRNPLASIQLYANMLSEDLAHMPLQHDVATKIAAAVRGLDGIVNDVLSFSREVKLRPIVCYVDQLFDRAVEALRPMIEQTEIKIIIDCPNELGVRCDSELLHQCLVNVMRNGIEAMGEAGTLSLTATAEGDAISLVVRDTGPGISAESIDRIFNPFFTTRHTGTGLGLAIVHRIIDAHGGTIGVHCDLGAVFTITMPCVPEQQTPSPVVTAKENGTAMLSGDDRP